MGQGQEMPRERRLLVVLELSHQDRNKYGKAARGPPVSSEVEVGGEGGSAALSEHCFAGAAETRTETGKQQQENGKGSV